MKIRKSKEADLEKKRKGFLVIGLSVACAFTLTAFEWITYEKAPVLLGGIDIVTIDEDPIDPFRKEAKKVQLKTKNPDKFKVVDVIIEPKPILDPVPEPDPDPITPEIFDLDSLDDGGIDPVETMPYIIVEQMPEFPGGEAAMFKWLHEHSQFPEMCRVAGISGKASVRFVVDEEGKISQIQTYSREHKAFEKEARRLVANMPTWKPGMQQGRKVKVYFSLPVDFKLK